MSASVALKNRIIVIANLFHTRHKACNIIRGTGYAPTTVYRIVSNVKQGEGIQMKAHRPRSDRIKYQKFPWLKRSTAENPSLPIPALVKKQNMYNQNYSFLCSRKNPMMMSFCSQSNNILMQNLRSFVKVSVKYRKSLLSMTVGYLGFVFRGSSRRKLSKLSNFCFLLKMSLQVWRYCVPNF